MARPNKAGLDYFPFDVDFHDDDKIALLTSEFNVIAEAIIIRLLCKIYKNGYYYMWGEDERLLFCRWAGGIFVPNQVDEVIKGCLRRSLFDKGVFEMFGVLTSKGIQRRFLQACQERKSIDIISDYWLLELPSNSNFNIIRENNLINRANNSVNQPEKYIKKSKVNNTLPPIIPQTGDEDSEKTFSDNSQKEKKKSSAKRKELDLSIVDSAFREVVDEWLGYKSERGESYKPRGFTIFYKRLKEISGNNPAVARKIVERSMSCNYSGIFPLGSESVSNKHPATDYIYDGKPYEQF